MLLLSVSLTPDEFFLPREIQIAILSERMKAQQQEWIDNEEHRRQYAIDYLDRLYLALNPSPIQKTIPFHVWIIVFVYWAFLVMSVYFSLLSA